MNIYYEYYFDGKLIARDERKTCAVLVDDPGTFDGIPIKLSYVGSHLNTVCFQFDLTSEPEAIYNICPMKG